MPNISVECNGTTVDVIDRYKPVEHSQTRFLLLFKPVQVIGQRLMVRLSVCTCAVKVNPPGLPSVNRTVNYTWICWSPGSPQSVYIELLEFQVEVAQENQTWKVSVYVRHTLFHNVSIHQR